MYKAKNNSIEKTQSLVNALIVKYLAPVLILFAFKSILDRNNR